MKVVALVSGGKDSCMNMIMCEKHGHKVVALANLYPADDKVDELDSHMYQTVGHHAISVYSVCMGLPLFRRKIKGKSLQLGMEYDKKQGDEVEDLRILLQAVKKHMPDIQGVSCGAILSDYQRLRVEAVCASLGLTSLSYLWQRNQTELLKEMLAVPIEAILVKVAAAGLEPEKHLGMTIAEVAPTLFALDKKFGSHVCGEGGEYETFVTDCPLFKAKIVLEETRIVPHPSGDSSVAFLHLEAFHIEPKAGVSASEAMTAVVEEVHDPTDAAPAAAPQEPPPSVPGSVAVTRGDAMWTFQFRAAAGAGGTSDVEQLLAALHALQKEMAATRVSWADSLMVHLYLRDMSQFAAVNATYIRVVPATAPPARACLEACLPDGTLVAVDVLTRAPGQSAHRRGCLHVQSVSAWAPACIGPYAQGTRAMGLVHLAGQIGLDPASMALREEPRQAAQAVANASAVAKCLRAPLETCALYCTLYALDHSQLIAGAAAWNLQLDTASGGSGASDDPDADPEGGPAWRHKWRPPLTYLVMPHLPRGACVEVEPVTLHAADGEWGADTDDSSVDALMGAMLRSETVRPASVGLGGAQLKSSALYHQGHFCRSTASLSWPKDAEAPGTGPAGEDDEDSMHLADAVAQGIIRALAANLHYSGLSWADAFSLRVYASKRVMSGLGKGAPDGMRRLQEAFDTAFSSGGMMMGAGASEGSGPKKVPSAVVVPVEACGMTPEAEAGILAEVVALRLQPGSGSA